LLSNGAVVASTTNDVSDGNDDLQALWSSSGAKYIDEIEYTVTTENWAKVINILKSEYQDFFKVGNDYAKVFKAD
jgi:uncharacterized membrane protein YcgQ (UPF0703/DUF1980 family)